MLFDVFCVRMALVVVVHGIGQQYGGDAVLHKDWWPALQSGLHMATHGLRDERDLYCPFYGHVFRKPGDLARADQFTPRDIGPRESELLELLWEAAVATEPDRVPAPSAYAADEALARIPLMVQSALNALSQSSFLVNVGRSMLIGDITQVTRYQDDPTIRAQIQDIVSDAITDDTRVVVGHSLGSVVAYEVLCRDSKNVVGFVSLGSPLGIRNVIFDRLQPPPDARIGHWPGNVAYWTNIADTGDIVAMQKQLAALFGDRVTDVLVGNGSAAHHGERYLTSKEAGEAIKQGL